MPSVVASNVPDVSTLPVASSSITAPGGTRPPAPTTVAAGSPLPEESTVIAGDVSSVVVRFVDAAPPGRNSVTVPTTCTSSPTATVGATFVKTKIASEVATFASDTGSWR